MWCPKCKTEYVNGITKCADCGIDLVESLPAASYEALSSETKDKLEHLKATEASKNTIQPKDGSTLYIDKHSQYEEMKSSAYTFLMVGALGILALVLVGLDIIPLHMASYMKIIMAIVMGGLFLFFLIIGAKSYQKMKILAKDAKKEETDTQEILTWFLNKEDADSIDASIPHIETTENEQLYFYRYEYIKGILSEKYPDFDENYAEALIEKIYTKLFPDNP